jgi:hypothetical protein
MADFISVAGFAIAIVAVVAFVSNSIGMFEAISGVTSTTTVFFVFGLVGGAIGELIGRGFGFGSDVAGFYLPSTLLIAMLFMFVIPWIIESLL